MSGGHFNYKQYELNYIVDEIEEVIRNNEDVKIENNYKYEPETILMMKVAIDLLNKASIYTQRIDYLLSDDDSEETFMKRLKEDLDKLKSKG